MTPDNDAADVDGSIPDLLHSQKTYIFKALEQDAFPRFLRAKAFGNLTPLGSFVRLALGLFCLWAGFVVAFTLIFLDYEPKIRRLWVRLAARAHLNTNSLAAHSSFHARHQPSPIVILRPLAPPCPLASIRNDPVQAHQDQRVICPTAARSACRLDRTRRARNHGRARRHLLGCTGQKTLEGYW